MAGQVFKLARLEGGAVLAQDAEGRIRLSGAPSRQFEHRLLGRSPLDAVYLTQQISAESGISHALAALAAWESVGGLAVAENGRLLRELLYSLSMLHAHLHQFYIQALPDYLPWGTLAKYEGSDSELLRSRKHLLQMPKGHWSRHSFKHPFSADEQRRLWDHRALAVRWLSRLQRMMAIIGGKYPMVMSLVPGGVNLPLDAATVIKLKGYLNGLRPTIENMALEDGLLVLKRHPVLKTLGRGSEDFLSVGLGTEKGEFDSALFPSGILLSEKLEPFASIVTESLHSAYYDLPVPPARTGSVTPPAPDKAGAYSWIKAPRYQGRPMETGAIARLVVTYLSGARMWRPDLVKELEPLLGQPIRRGNTVAGRMLARSGEIGGLAERAEALLERIDPARPAVLAEENPFTIRGEGFGWVAAPAGALQHHIVLAAGRITHYDIVTPSTWNGSPRDSRGETGSLETALNRTPSDLSSPAHRLQLSRIVHSFAFSMSDAVH